LPSEFPETDAALVQRVRDGDRSAFGELVKRYQSRVYRLAMRFTKSPDEALEVLQETFLNVFRKLDGFRAESAFSSWLYRITVNTSLMHLRKGRSGPQEVPLEDLPASLGPVAEDWSGRADSAALRDEARKLIQEAVDELPEKYRTVFLLRDVEDLSTEEVAEILEITVPTVKTRLHRARLHLRDRLAGYYEERR
jgi:RNA polymerase sigma-70 factor, ECF subfamily